MNSRIVIIVGHNARAQGATRVLDGRTEWDWNGKLAHMIRDHDPANVSILLRQGGGGYSREIDRVYAEADRLGAACTVELHFNGSSSPQANGGLTLSSGTSGSLALAAEVRARAAKALGNRDRGIKTVRRTDRGGRSLWQGRAPAILTEPYFGSNAGECVAADLHMDELAEAVFRGATAFLGQRVAA